MYEKKKNLIEYHPENKTVLLREPIFHVVHVSSGGAHMERFGYNELRIDFNPSGNGAVIYGHLGSTKITVKPSPDIGYRERTLVGRRKGSKTFQIGCIGHSEFDGKEALLDALERFPDGKENDGKNSVLTLSFFLSRAFDLAREQKITPEFPSMLEEMGALKKREDFALDKDYTTLYPFRNYAPIP